MSSRYRLFITCALNLSLRFPNPKDSARIVCWSGVGGNAEGDRLVEFAEINSRVEIGGNGLRHLAAHSGCIGEHVQLELGAMDIERRFVDPDIDGRFERSGVIDQRVNVLLPKRTLEIGIVVQQLLQRSFV